MANLSDSAINIDQYNSRATYVYKNASAQKGFHRDSEGTLWAAIVTQQKTLAGYQNVGTLDLYKSTDDGFIWNFVISLGVDHVEDPDTYTTNYYGAPIFMFDDKFGNLWLIRSDSDEAIQMDAVSKSAGTSTNYLYWGDAFAPDWADYNQPFKNGQFTICGDANSMLWMFLSSTATASLISIPFDMGFAHPRPRVAIALPTVDWLSAMDSVDSSGVIHVLGQDTSCNVRSVRMTKYATSGSFDSSVVVHDTYPIFATDFAIDKDGLETLCAMYTVNNAASTSGDLHYKMSFNDGTTWPTSGTIDMPAGTSIYTDNWEDNLSAAVSGSTFNSKLIANNAGGFMFSAIFVNDTTSTPQLYVNEFTTVDGATYTSPSGWVSVASRTDQTITGAEFFRPMNTAITYFGNKADMRMAYVVGHGNDAYGNDQMKTAVFQERLNTNAYPDPIDQVTMTQKNIDFEASGFIGDHTTLYSGVFDAHATSGHLVQHEPVSGSNTNGESAYTQEAEYTTDIFFDTISYDRPQVESIATSSQVKAVERDIRKIFIRPDFYLSRTFLVNDGGFLKRTVWILEHFGITYEITQIVPKFIENQICYYEANAFVVGPSNNPFTRSVLPSET